MIYEDWESDEIIPEPSRVRIRNIHFPRVASLREARGDKCELCSSTKDLEFAHIKETGLRYRGRGQTQRYYDILNNPECYKLVCKNCHRKFDKGEITINDR